MTATPPFSRELDQLRQQDNWVSVSERPPDIGTPVLVVADDMITEWVQEAQRGDGGWRQPDGSKFPCIVSYWQPMPLSPSRLKKEFKKVYPEVVDGKVVLHYQKP